MQTLKSLPPPPSPPQKKKKLKIKRVKGEEGLYENGHKWLTHVLHCHGIELSTL